MILARLTALAALLGLLIGARPALAASVPSVTNPRNFAGVNVPWFAWGCDFGCSSTNGVSSKAARAELANGFAKLKPAGIHTVRWWTFEGDPWQINHDSSGAPTSLNPAVYADFDAALALADQYDLVYDFVLFSAPTAIPRAWVTDPGQRQKLAAALAPLFEHYRNNPRILAWEIFNEPEWDIWSNQIPQAPVQATVSVLARTIHAHTSTPVTVGSANLDGLSMWAGQGLDFLSPHWYDPMTGSSCARCTDTTALAGSNSAGLPIIIGEFYGGPDVDTLQRLKDLRAKGYAGAWAWSLFSDHTSDKMKVDLSAMSAFASSATAQPAAAAPAQPSPTAAPTSPGQDSTIQLLSNWVSPTYISPGDQLTLYQDIQSAVDTTVLVDFEIFDEKGQRVWQGPLDNQRISANSISSFTASAPTTNLPAGHYTLKTGVFSPGWGTMYAWSDSAGTFTVDTTNLAPPVLPALNPAASPAGTEDAPAAQPETAPDE